MVKVRLLLFTVTSGLSELIATVTSAVGAVFSFTSYVPVAPSRMVRAAGVKVMPRVSSSSTVTVTVSVTPAYSPPDAVFGHRHGLVVRVAVINASDGDRLLRIPVRRGEPEGGAAHRRRARVVRADGDGHGGGGLGLQLHGVGVLAALIDVQERDRELQAGSVVVGDGDDEVLVLARAVAAAAGAVPQIRRVVRCVGVLGGGGRRPAGSWRS